MGRTCFLNRGLSFIKDCPAWRTMLATERGAPRKCYEDCLKKSIAAYHVDQLCGRVTCRHCRQPNLPNFLYSSNTTSWRLMRRANNDQLCWSDMATDRDAWRHPFFKAVNEFEEDKREAHEDKRSKWKARAASNTTPEVTFTYGHCSWPCIFYIALVSHECACR